MGWLAQGPGRQVSVVATAMALDDEMTQRVARHQLDRPSNFATLEEPIELGACLRRHGGPNHLLLVDCLTLWATNVLMPRQPDDDLASRWDRLQADLLAAMAQASGPIVLVSNEMGWGVIPMGEAVRQFVDAMGRLNQAVAQRCGHVTLMAAGQPWTKAVQPW